MDVFRKFRVFEKSPLAKLLPWELVDIIGDYLYEPVEIELYKSIHRQNILECVETIETDGSDFEIYPDGWKDELKTLKTEERSKQWLHIIAILEVWGELDKLCIHEMSRVLYEYKDEVYEMADTFLTLLYIIDQSDLSDQLISSECYDILGSMAKRNLVSYRSHCQNLINEGKTKDHINIIKRYEYYLSLMQEYYPQIIEVGNLELIHKN